jgi:hypothetical protein
MMSIVYSLVLALVIIAIWSVMSQLLFPAPHLDFADRWITQGVRCPRCDSTYAAKDIESSLAGWSGESVGVTIETITCSSCGIAACFSIEHNIRFVYFAPTDRYCLDCDNKFEGRMDQECPFCGGLHSVEAERDDGEFHYRPKQATNKAMDAKCSIKRSDLR